MADYVVQRVTPTIYLDSAGSPVNGFKITVYLAAYDEIHYLEVPKLDPVDIKKRADKLVADRVALSKL
jgi:hypothetical protein